MLFLVRIDFTKRPRSRHRSVKGDPTEPSSKIEVQSGQVAESHEDFEKTKQLLLETKPDIVNLSRYSARPGTEAAEMVQIDVSEVKKRSKEIFETINQISIENNQKWVGWKGEVLFDEKTDEGIKGRNFAYKSIFVNESVEIGDVHNVEITGFTQHSLVGTIIS